MSEQAIEQEVLEKDLNTLRITPGEIEASIERCFYFTGEDGVRGAMGQVPVVSDGYNRLGMLTFCVLILRNGFTVTGEYACTSPKDFDSESSHNIARQNAVAKIGPLMGYQLHSKLAGGEA